MLLVFKFIKLQNVLVLLLCFMLVYSCTPTAPTPPVAKVSKPVVTFSLSTITSGIDTIKSTYVVVSGFIADTGRTPITDHGFIVSTDTTNLISGQSNTSSNVIKVSLGPLRGGGGFTAKISGLTIRCKYSIACYATNNAGTSYSTDSLKNPVDIKFTTKLDIGESYGGGIVVYLMQPGDTTYDANLQHGLIAATSDQSSAAKWTDANQLLACKALGVNLLQGKSNTDSIIKYYPSPITTAASIAKAHRGGNYSDWYLPNQNELNKLFKSGIANGSKLYWSSSELEYYLYAYLQNFFNGFQYGTDKRNTNSVRAIRAF